MASQAFDMRAVFVNRKACFASLLLTMFHGCKLSSCHSTGILVLESSNTDGGAFITEGKIFVLKYYFSVMFCAFTLNSSVLW